jgi:hypothetical protein
MRTIVGFVLCGALLAGCGMVALLEAAAAEAVTRAFASKPEVIYVQVASRP